MKNGKIGVTTENIFPVIKKFLYSDHEIFLRELISNAVDATQKLKTLSSIGEMKGDLGDLTIRVSADKDAKTLTVTDRGIGMTAEEVEGDYEKQTGCVIVRRFATLNPIHTPGVLVKNHGPFSWGRNAAEAVHNAVVMEQVAKMAFVAYSVNPDLKMNPLLVEKHFNRKHGPNAYYGQKKG